MAKATNLLYQRYRLIALVVYAAVLLAGIVDWGYGGIGPRAIVRAPEDFRFAIFVMAMLVLIGLELRGMGRANFGVGLGVGLGDDLSSNYGVSPRESLGEGLAARLERTPKITKLTVLLPFVARFLLFVTACLVTDLNYSKILFLTLLLYSYLAVSKRLSYFLAVLGVAVLFGLAEAQIDVMRQPPPRPIYSGELPAPAGPNLGGILVDRSMGSLITLLFTLLLARAMSQAIQSQQKLSDLLTSLETSHRQLKQYSNRVAELAATEERNRLARDIHDSLGHHLAAINIQLEKANAYRQRDPQRAYEAVNYAQRTVQDALKDVRESVNSLRKEEETFSFQDSLWALIRRMHHSELSIALNQRGNSSRYSRLKLMTLYRVVQEGLTNVHKHANASQVEVAINFGPDAAQLKLTDNGSGFDVAVWEKHAHQDQATQGLTGLQERLSLVGGTFNITSEPSGTTLTSAIPQQIALESTRGGQ
ncbi:MAG: sensor histidine kinase [Cyanobacteria bacterium J06626_6]